MRRSFIAVAVIAVIAVVGIALSISGRSGTQGSAVSSGAQDEGSGAVQIDSATEGPAPTQPDARRAAVNAVAFTDDVFIAGFISRRELIESFATKSFGKTLADETSQQVTSLLFELGERDVVSSDLSIVEQPITVDVIEESDDAARVDVWSVLVIAADGAGPARQVWRTVQVELALVAGTWLVDGWTSVLGPTPALAPEANLAAVDDVARAIGWLHVSDVSS